MKIIFKVTILEVFGVKHRICIFVGVNHKIYIFVGVNHVRCIFFDVSHTPLVIKQIISNSDLWGRFRLD